MRKLKRMDGPSQQPVTSQHPGDSWAITRYKRHTVASTEDMSLSLMVMFRERLFHCHVDGRKIQLKPRRCLQTFGQMGSISCRKASH